METRYPDAPNGNTLERGEEFEDFVCDVLQNKCGIVLRTYKSASRQLKIGENKAGFEIKLDKQHQKYSHLSIEVAERTRNGGPWWKSGIFRDDNSWLYIHGNKNLFWIFHKPALMEHARKYGIVGTMVTSEECPSELHESFGTIRKFYLEYDEADRIGQRIENGNKSDL